MAHYHPTSTTGNSPHYPGIALTPTGNDQAHGIGLMQWDEDTADLTFARFQQLTIS